jgi:RNA polymerase sigma factor (sigma-70 family)
VRDHVAVGLGRADDSRADLASVLERARAGSDVAFEAVFHELSPAVAGYLRLNGVSEVDELTNEVFAQVHRGLPRFKGDWGGFRSWVFTIAHHRMVDDARRARRRPQIAQAEVAEEAAAGDVESEALAALSDERLLQLLSLLSEDQRQVLLLRIVADLPLEEAAATLGKTVGAVKSLQHRALASLRRSLEQAEVEHGT